MLWGKQSIWLTFIVFLTITAFAGGIAVADTTAGVGGDIRPTPAVTDPKAETVVIATREDLLTNRYADQVLKEAYARIGVKALFNRLPGARSVGEADKGKADGEAARLAVVLKRYPNLRLVPEPLFFSELSIFNHADDKSLDAVAHKAEATGAMDWAALKAKSVVTILGFQLVRSKLANQEHQLVRASSQAVKMVAHKHADTAILNSFLGNLAVAETGSIEVREIKPPLERIPVYHLVHKKHTALIPKLTRALKAMRLDKTMDSMWHQFGIEQIKLAQQKAAMVQKMRSALGGVIEN